MLHLKVSKSILGKFSGFILSFIISDLLRLGRSWKRETEKKKRFAMSILHLLIITDSKELKSCPHWINTLSKSFSKEAKYFCCLNYYIYI